MMPSYGNKEICDNEKNNLDNEFGTRVHYDKL